MSTIIAILVCKHGTVRYWGMEISFAGITLSKC